MRLAIVHDFLNQYGGAEKCVESFHELFPDAPVFTSIYIPENMPEVFKSMDIRVSFMQRFPFLELHFKKFVLFYPKAIESLDLSGYDVILSSSSAFAKGIKKDRNACHICYCYTPMRFAWDYERYMEKENMNLLLKKGLSFCIPGLKQWDLKNNDNVDQFISISQHIRKRIQTCYQRESDVIYPPVDVASFSITDKPEDYYLIVSRLNAYKRIDLVIEAFNRMRLPLRIVGAGPHRAVLEKMAGPTVKFMGRIDDKELAEQYARCKAFIFPGEEDFGIAPVEAQAAGRPVIAYAGGGAMETVIDGVTGIFFKEQTVDALVDAIRRFKERETAFCPGEIVKHALKFDKRTFVMNIQRYVKQKSEEFARAK
ncbi:MAG: glycosyltransferase [Endomicrobiales bacterium]